MTVGLQMTVKDFPLRDSRIYTPFFSYCRFGAGHLRLLALLLSQVTMQQFYMLKFPVFKYTQNLPIALQNQSWYEGQVHSSLDLLISLKKSTSQPNQKIHFSFPLLRRKCSLATCAFTLYSRSKFSLKTLRNKAHFCQKFHFISSSI